jgi:predicted Zn-dependent protease
MQLIRRFALGLILLCAGCAREPEEKAITLVNAAAVDAALLEQIRSFVQNEWQVPVRAKTLSKLAGKPGFRSLESAARRVKSEDDVVLIVLAGFNGEPQHLNVFSNSGIAVVNVQPLYTDDAQRFALRVERQVMRAAAFSFGLPPTPDPFCVTRDYVSLEDLDRMGRNYSPPWQGRFADEAARRGLGSLSANDALSSGERLPNLPE